MSTHNSEPLRIIEWLNNQALERNHQQLNFSDFVLRLVSDSLKHRYSSHVDKSLNADSSCKDVDYESIDYNSPTDSVDDALMKDLYDEVSHIHDLF